MNKNCKRSFPPQNFSTRGKCTSFAHCGYWKMKEKKKV